MAAWWFAVWLSIGRREQFVLPFLGVLVLGLGLPIMAADKLVSSGHGGDRPAPTTVVGRQVP
jgi:hypothetical protein